MKRLVVQVVVASLLLASVSPAARADGATTTGSSTQSQARPTEEVHGDYYLHNCDDILTTNSDEFERAFVANARTESQMLQLMYDGGLIFSNLFTRAFFVTLDQNLNHLPPAFDFSQLNKGNIKKTLETHSQLYQKLARDLTKLAQSSSEQLNSFIWSLLENEVNLSAFNVWSSDSTDASAEVRYNQVRRLVKALRSTPNSALIEKSLRDVASQALLSFTRELILTINGSTQNNEADSLLFTIQMFGGSFAGAIVSLPLMSDSFMFGHPMAAFSVFMGSLFSGAFLPFIVEHIIGQTAPFHRRGALPSPERMAYVMPNGSREERFEIADILKSDLTAPDKTPYAISLAKACEGNTCHLTPIQIASIGDLDLLELERLFASLRSSFSVKMSPENNNLLRDALNTVIEKPENYRDQMNLRRRLLEFESGVALAASEREQIFNQVTEKIKTLKINFGLLRERPFTELRTNDEELARGQLLLSKINNDLVRLDNVSLDAEKFQRSIDQLHATKSIIDGWVNSLPKSEYGWREAAQNILNELDQAEAAR